MTTILVVDDEYDILCAVKGVLEDEGYDVVACSTGREALNYLADGRPSVILMDVMMPYMSGFDVLEALSKIPELSGLPVVMMSAVEPGAKQSPKWKAFLKKPFTLERLIQTVESVAREGAPKS
jgi:CheY-like chemotaxis protein